jgi:hypothetical protein
VDQDGKEIAREHALGTSKQVREGPGAKRASERLLLAVLLRAFGDGVLGVVGFRFRLSELFVAGFVEGGAEAHVDREALAGAAFINAANRGHVTVVAAIGYADMTKLDGFTESGIEAEPAAAG